MQNNKLILFLVEIGKRLGTKSPKFFQVIQWISLVMIALTGLPEVLESIRAFNINLPEWVDTLANKTVAFASMAVFFISALTTQSTPVAINQNGEVLKKGNSNALPFTAKYEKKLAVKNDVKLSVVTDETKKDAI